VRFDGRRKRDVEDVAVRVAKAAEVAAETALSSLPKLPAGAEKTLSASRVRARLRLARALLP
jgi:hypothetical protein